MDNEEKKVYCVDVDIVISRSFYVDATNEEEAREIVNGKIRNYPFSYTGGKTYVTHEITDVYEEE